ncbi:MAG: 2-C-methyl-D-erythritol 2,4-cyclodiphosphate synthase [Turneriella sp.]
MRIGLGYDIHRTGEGDHVWLGGIRVAAPFSLVGHSDADVLLHAITDAILGAIADYDIGHHFPPSDEANRGRPSADFLRYALERMLQRGYAIANVDCNIICELPRIAPVREDIRSSLSALLGIGLSQISVKGRTNEKTDAVGEGRAVVCQAVVLLTESGESR